MRDDLDMAPLVRIEAATFRVAALDLLRDISLVLGHGAPTAVIGPNGSGKTTLLRAIMGLISPVSGVVDVGHLRQAFVFQKPVMLRRTVAENVAFALTAAGGAADHVHIDALLERVDLARLAHRPARRLSGGEQQRLAIARALAREPQLLLLDEATASLDPAQTKIVEDLIASIARSGVKVVFATHDIGQARRLSGDIVLLIGGRVAEHAPTAQFFADPASSAARRFIAGDLVLEDGPVP